MNVTSISVLNFHWKDWCWSWNTNTLAIWCEKLSHWKWHWCWERIKTRGKEDDRGWDGWMASPTQRTWVWASSGHWEWTGKPGLLQCKESQAVGQNWMTELTGGKKKIKLIADLLLFSKTGNTFFFTKKNMKCFKNERCQTRNVSWKCISKLKTKNILRQTDADSSPTDLQQDEFRRKYFRQKKN